MTPLPSIGLTSGRPQLGATSAAPDQPGLFDLVLSLRQQGSETNALKGLLATDAPASFLQTACPLPPTTIGQPSSVAIGVARILAAPVAAVTGELVASADKLVPGNDTPGAKEFTPTAPLTSNNNTPEVTEKVRQAPSVLPYLAQNLTALSAKISASDVDDRTESDEKSADEGGLERASTPAIAQIWAMVSAANIRSVETSPKGEARDRLSGEREPSVGGPLAFLGGKGAKVTVDPTEVRPSDVGPEKSLRKFVETLSDAVPLPTSHGREQVSLVTQQLGPARTDSAALPNHSPVGDIDTKQLDLLMRDISELTSTSGKTAFHLSSEHLGRLQVRLETTDVGVSVAIRTDNEHGHVTVSQAQKQLQDDLHANGLKVAETSVALGQSGAEQQRSDRNAHVRIVPKIEVALEQSSLADEHQIERPDGRFA